MTPDQIIPGHKYRLSFRYAIPRRVIEAEVLRIEDDQAIVRSLTGREVPIPLSDFAALAKEEVS